MKSALPAVLLLLLQSASCAPIAAASSRNLLLPVAATKVHLDAQPTAVSNVYSARYPSTRAEEEAIQNTPYDPPESIPVSAVLASQKPLSSAYLRSLSAAAPAATKVDRSLKDDVSRSLKELAAKPTGALESLRKEDLDRYWASKEKGSTSASASAKVSETVSSLLNYGNDILLPGNVYIKSHNMSQQTDMIIVGIVLLFLILVVAVEGIERIRECYKRCFSTCSQHRKYGAIYPEPLETVTFVAKE